MGAGWGKSFRFWRVIEGGWLGLVRVDGVSTEISEFWSRFRLVRRFWGLIEETSSLALDSRIRLVRLLSPGM